MVTDFIRGEISLMKKKILYNEIRIPTQVLKN